MDIIPYLIQLTQYQHKQISLILILLYKYIVLKQCFFDDSHSTKYQEFKLDSFPEIIYDKKWDYKDYIHYLE